MKNDDAAICECDAIEEADEDEVEEDLADSLGELRLCSDEEKLETRRSIAD